MEEALGSKDFVEEQVHIDQCVVGRLARVAKHGAQAPFFLGYFPVKPGSFSVLGTKPAQDYSLGKISDVNGRIVGTIDYEKGTGTLDWKFIDQNPAFWVRYRVKVQDA